ncbi:hypothetical protein COHA_001842 [Chlorella ohadii]|uniref:Uncharacterized protein n=1 Tax=Chlorella ohadii TaxID=2649997 RepID=A0AAD5DVU9_9CHLO|nr:hypothetical protein COHA_001842 [Chlorella ohadii]
MPAAAVASSASQDVAAAESAAARAYANRDFEAALAALDELVRQEPQELRWREMRAQALVDAKNFLGALDDFDFALKRLPADAQVDRARLLSGRGLAYEGLGDWVAALKDYKTALQVAEAAGQLPDPYVLNSVGNCHSSLGEWRRARESYLAAAEGFQRAAGFRYGRSTTPRLDGAVFASSNAALMLAQLGDEEGAVREMQAIARKAPGSVDMRAALAALYWRQGQEAAAEAEWNFACTSITTGCSKYQDQDWLQRIRRWPPIMCQYMRDFLALRSNPAPAGGSSGSRGGGNAGGPARAAFRE